MRILVFSDSHGNVSEMLDVTSKVCADLIIHLGDGCRDAATVASVINKPLISVAGNCDIARDVPYTIITDINNFNVYICHGNAYSGDYREICKAAKTNGCELAFFGHTHVPLDTVYDGVRIINPGSIGKPKYEFPNKSYALCEITPENINCSLCKY